MELRPSEHTSDSTDPSDVECPVTRFLRVVGGKWKLLLVMHISQGTNRFGQLQRAIPAISKQMLTTQLRELEADGIVHREIFPVVPPRVEYTLTELGRSLLPVVGVVREWGIAHGDLAR